jgi:ABC-type lipoprotein release transport system permease subunit
MLSHGIEVALTETGSEGNAIVLRRSAGSELVSQIDREAGNIIRTLPEVAKRTDGKPLATTETYIVINLAKKVSRDMGNIAVRGISPEALEIRPTVRLTEGRMFRFGTNEILVGENVAKNFEGCGIGQTLRFAEGTWVIVGRFAAEGSAFESEVWGDVDQFMSAFGRPVFSSLTVRLGSPSEFEAFKARVGQDPRTQAAEVKRERQYYREQSELMSSFIRILGLMVTLIFSIGAVIAAVITMYAAVANRTVEIGTLRALGFRRRSVLGAFLIESILLSLLGGALGIALAALMSFFRISTVNFGSFSELAFGFVLSPDIVLSAILFALAMGILGGFFPAVRAARLNILAALREA